MKKLKLLIPIFIFCFILCLIMIIIVGWLGLDFYRSAQVNALIRPEASFPLKLKWEVDLGHFSYQNPAYQAGLILMPASERLSSRWYGVDANTGEVVWTQSIKEYSFRHCLTPEYLVLSSPGSFINLSTRTGEVVWEEEVSYGTTCNEEMVFSTGVPRDSISAHTLSTGQELWNGTTPRKSFYGIVYNFETTEIIATHAEDFYLIDPETGLLKHSFSKVAYAPDDGDPSRGPIYLVDRGELFIGGNVQNAQTGQIIHREEHYTTLFPPTITADTMYLSARFDGVVAFDRANYNVKWIYPSPPQKFDPEQPLHTLSSVAILDGMGYVIFSDATVRAFDLATGQELGYWQPKEDDLQQWPICTYPSPTFGCKEMARAGLTTSGDMLFVSFGDGKLYAFGQ